MCLPATKCQSRDASDVWLTWIEDNSQWVDRASAEIDPSFRQVIPYITVISDQGNILVYDRAGSEQRLHGLMSVGFGGHIEEPEDILDAAERELEEELGLIHCRLHPSRGPILLDDTMVDKVHMGLPMYTVVDEGQPQPSSEIQSFRWLSPQDFFTQNYELAQFEAWSVAVLPYVLKIAMDIQYEHGRKVTAR